MLTLFGTDGVRGAANAFINPEFVLKFSMIVAKIMRTKYGATRVVIGKDTRVSCYMIESAAAAGFTAAGMDVLFLGVIPTPGVSVLIRSLRADFGIMISASHNLYQDNGIKLFNRHGDKVDAILEREIETIFYNIQNLQALCVPGDVIGKSYRIDGALDRYIESIKSYFYKDTLNLAGMKIVVDVGHGAAYRIVKNLLWELGAEVVLINATPNGFNINDKCGSTDTNLLREAVRAHQAHVGFALDGDADRVVVVDEIGEAVNGDQLIGAIAFEMYSSYKLRNNIVAITQLSNFALDDFLHHYNIKIIRTDVGDKNIAHALREHHGVFGGEKSGHLLFTDYCPTGDALIAILMVLQILSKSRDDTVLASQTLRPFELHPEACVNINCAIGYNTLELSAFDDIVAAGKQILQGQCITLRKSGTEQLIRLQVQGRDITLVNQALSYMKHAIHTRLPQQYE